ncbi:MAG: hypothetical protein HF978_17025 [Desulfobacteraceae bacterium]|nr:hypothetical protein [Desulfobacteraceae bacterium]MBC2757248.1 hypothetical protein [Desulfobacteraceae bacterium]
MWRIKRTAFRIYFAAFLAQYRYAMDFIDISDQNPDFHVVLNESVPEIGLPGFYTYAALYAGTDVVASRWNGTDCQPAGN